MLMGNPEGRGELWDERGTTGRIFENESSGGGEGGGSAGS